MEAAFELTEADLFEVQRQRAVMRRRFIQKPGVLVFITLLAGILAWPIARFLLGTFPGGALLPWVACVVIAGAVVLGLRKHLRHLRLRAFEAWSLQRATKRSMKRSVLGRVTVVLTPSSIKRLRENAPALELAGSDITSVTVSRKALVMQLSLRRVLVVPRRAFEDDAQANAFQKCVELIISRPANFISDDE